MPPHREKSLYLRHSLPRNSVARGFPIGGTRSEKGLPRLRLFSLPPPGQRKAIDRDAAGDAALVGVGMLLFWPAALFAIGDADEAEEYARLKGEYEALQEAGRAKNCAIEYKPLQEPAEAASATAP